MHETKPTVKSRHNYVDSNRRFRAAFSVYTERYFNPEKKVMDKMMETLQKLYTCLY
jgi:hypothetical protein